MYILENGLLVGSKTNTIASADPSEMQRGPIYSVLFKHPDGYVLLDAGCHVDEKRQFPMIYRDFSMKPEDHIISRLAAVGVEPGEIKHIVVSHLHADHSGFIELFPNAELIVHEDEFTHRARQYALNDPSGGSLGDMELWISLRLKWRLVGRGEEEIRLLPGITILNFGSGHSFGMLGVLASLPVTGNFLFAGDAIYCRENAGPPIMLPGIVYDKEAYTRTVENILKMARETNAMLIYGHDEMQFDSLIKSTQGCYE